MNQIVRLDTIVLDVDVAVYVHLFLYCRAGADLRKWLEFLRIYKDRRNGQTWASCCRYCCCCVCDRQLRTMNISLGWRTIYSKWTFVWSVRRSSGGRLEYKWYCGNAFFLPLTRLMILKKWEKSNEKIHLRLFHHHKRIEQPHEKTFWA